MLQGHTIARSLLLTAGILAYATAEATALAQAASTGVSNAGIAAPRVLDSFDTREGWGMFPSEGVKLSLLPAQGVSGNALTLAYDFDGKAGYAIARKAFPIGTPTGNWSISFKARGNMRPNTLEFKLLDKSGDNVWWYTIPEFQPSGQFQTIAVRQRQVSFAWGPVGGGPPRDIAAIELVVTAGQGGRGTLTIDDLVFTPLPADVPVTRVATATATGTASGSQAVFAIDGDTTTIWRAAAAATGARPVSSAPPPAALVLDLGGIRTYGGLVVHWMAGQQAGNVVVDSSNNRTDWHEAGQLTGVRGARSYLPITDGSSRYLRLRFTGGTPGNGEYAVRDVSVRPLEFAGTPTALLRSIAHDAPRGEFPRALHDEQVYWAVVGVSGGQSEALLSEDGQLELAKRGPSLEPFLSIDNKLVTWADVMPAQSLLEDVRPVPSVTWHARNATLVVTAFAAGTAANASTYARYRLINRSGARMAGTFWLALRPLQVNPPWQFLNTPGGAARVDSLSWNGTTLRVNAALRVQPLTLPVRVGVSTLDAGEAISWIAANRVPEAKRVLDKRSLGSAVMAWSIDVAPGDSTDIVVASPLDGRGDPSAVVPGTAAAVRAAANARLRSVASTWARDQDAVTIHLPGSAPPVAAALKANLAWILINRDGPGIQPGSRSYERSWIRDGSLTAEALLRLGRATEAKQFAEWYAPFQYASGKVPCCVDFRGADPVDEHDSHGELIHLVHEVWRYTGDRAFAERMWPHVKLAAQFLDSLRRTHLTAEYDTPALRPYRGLLPPSISHEGYSAKPMHSYWDDGFALLGFREATSLAVDLGYTTDARRIGAWRDAFAKDFHASIAATMTLHKIGYIPGSVELGDFDATSTTTLIAPGGDLANLPRAAVDSTFSRYYRSARNRANPDSLWNDYTPYEWRTVGALLRLGRKTEALDLLTQFMGDRRPAQWQQWAEVVWRDARAPKFLGDMPHTWVGSDFIRSALDMFAHEREADSALVVGAGIPATWVPAGDSVLVRGLLTPWGPLGFSLRAEGATVTLRLDQGLRVPPGGIVVHSPLAARVTRATADGVDTPVAPNGTVTLSKPVRVLVLTHQ